MKTSLTDVARTEKFLLGELSPEDSVVYQARCLVNDDLRRDAFFHKMVHSLIRVFHRKRLKAEVQEVHDKLFNDPANAHFQQKVTKLFKP
jgi:hypothetical protein